jgi:hypothetical protein
MTQHSRSPSLTGQGIFLAFVIALLAPGALAQGTCFTLNKDNICGKDFEGLPVSLQTYKTNDEFNSIMTNTFNNVDSVAKEFDDVFGCSSAAVRPGITSMRFQISYACSDAVSKAIAAGCSPSTTPSGKGPALCLPQCEMAVATLERLFQDQTACPGGPKASNRSLVVEEMRRVCGTYRPAQNNQLCSLGTTAEGQFCGTCCCFKIYSWRSIKLTPCK